METSAESKKLFGKWFFVVLSGLLVLSIGIGITLALVLRKTESRANNFTFGNLSIALTEIEWDRLDPEDKVTYPGRKIPKDPKVTNTGETDGYLYLAIQIPRDTIRTVNADQTINDAKAMDLFTYTVNTGWTQVGTGKVSDDGKYTEYVYAYTASTVAPAETTPTLFDSVNFVNALEGEPEMETLLEIPVSAVGIQSGYLHETGDTLAEKIINAYEIAKNIEE